MERGRFANDSVDVLAVLKRPHVILRFISLVFAIVVTSCISNQAQEKNTCQFNRDPGACNYGMAVGILSICTIVIFIIIDFFFALITDEQMKKMIIFADAIFFGLWAFLWFVCFCYLADSWRKTDSKLIDRGWSGMQASIAFSFFSILTCGSIAAMAFMRCQQQGAGDDFMAGYNDPSLSAGGHTGSQSSYSSLPSGNTFRSSPRMPAAEQEASDTKPLTSDPSYQTQNY